MKTIRVAFNAKNGPLLYEVDPDGKVYWMQPAYTRRRVRNPELETFIQKQAALQAAAQDAEQAVPQADGDGGEHGN